MRDDLFRDLDRACAILEMAYGEVSGMSTEDLTRKDLLLDFFMGTISTVFHRIGSILTGHHDSVLADYVRRHQRAVADVLDATDLPYGKIILPSPQGMVWSYPKTIEALNTLYKEDPPSETVAFLKEFGDNLQKRDRVALADTLVKLQRDDRVVETEKGLMDLFVTNALGHKTAKTLFTNNAGLKHAYTLLTGMNDFYGQSIKAAEEIKRLEGTIRQAILVIIKGDGIDKDSATIAGKCLRILCARLRAMASLLVKMDQVEQNYVMCLKHLVAYRTKNI